MYTRFYPCNLDFLCIVADYLDNHAPLCLENVLVFVRDEALFIEDVRDPEDTVSTSLNLALKPIHPTPAWPDYACDRCNYDQHQCGGCGGQVPHKNGGTCDDCYSEYVAAKMNGELDA